MKRSAIVFLGLVVAFALLSKVAGGGYGGDGVTAEQPENQRQSDSTEWLESERIDQELLASYIAPDMSRYMDWRLAPRPSQDEGGTPETPDADADWANIFANARGWGNNGVIDWTPLQLKSLSNPWNDFDPNNVLDRWPSHSGAIILEYRCDASGVRSDGLIWGQQGGADLIDR